MMLLVLMGSQYTLALLPHEIDCSETAWKTVAVDNSTSDGVVMDQDMTVIFLVFLMPQMQMQLVSCAAPKV